MKTIIRYAMSLGVAAAMPLLATAGDKDNTCPASGAAAGYTSNKNERKCKNKCKQ